MVQFYLLLSTRISLDSIYNLIECDAGVGICCRDLGTPTNIISHHGRNETEIARNDVGARGFDPHKSFNVSFKKLWSFL